MTDECLGHAVGVTILDVGQQEGLLFSDEDPRLVAEPASGRKGLGEHLYSPHSGTQVEPFGGHPRVEGDRLPFRLGDVDHAWQLLRLCQARPTQRSGAESRRSSSRVTHGIPRVTIRLARSSQAFANINTNLVR